MPSLGVSCPRQASVRLADGTIPIRPELVSSRGSGRNLCLVIQESPFLIVRLGCFHRLLLLQAHPDSTSQNQSAAQETLRWRDRAPNDALDDEGKHKLGVLSIISTCDDTGLGKAHNQVGGPAGLLPLEALGQEKLQREARNANVD
jgi:hypothetical protein